MIEVEIYKKNSELLCGVQVVGHAGFAEMGQDIVCSAVSVLVLNTINAVETFTDIPFGVDVDDRDGGYLHFIISDEMYDNNDLQLLLKTLVLGLSSIEDEYDEHIKLLYKEV